MERRKHIIRWWIYTILLQLFIWLVAFFILYRNYDNITKSESIKENYTTTVSVHNSASINTWVTSWDILSWDLIYSWIIWNITIWQKDIWSTYQKKLISYKDININPTVHDTLDIFINQSSSLTRDKNTASYIIKQSQKDNFLQIINDLNFLSKYSNNNTIINPSYNPRLKLDMALSNKEPNYIINYLKELESNFIKYFMTREEKKWWDNNLLKSEKFAYVYNQLHFDKENKYKDHINLAAKIFNLNPNLIKACIFVEQLRAFYTFKWLFKSIAQTNTYLTVMSKQSFGIGWIKLQTAEALEEWLMTHEPELYKKYFSYENQNNIYQQRLERLIDSKTYYYQILYTAWILYQYKTKRKIAWYNINNKPWLMATMYNIWYSEPHSDADIWGSFMNIEWDKYSFWWLAMLIYYYLEIYG